MHHKFLWGGAALIVFGAAVTYCSVDYAVRHPQSVLARLGIAATFAGLNPNPLADVGRLLSGDQGEEQSAAVDDVEGSCDKPSDTGAFNPFEETIEPIQIDPMPQATVEPPVYEDRSWITESEWNAGPAILISPMPVDPVDETPIRMPYADETIPDQAEGECVSDASRILREIFGDPDCLKWQNAIPRFGQFEAQGSCSSLTWFDSWWSRPPNAKVDDDEQCEDEQCEDMVAPPCQGRCRRGGGSEVSISGEEERGEEEQSEQLLDGTCLRAFQLRHISASQMAKLIKDSWDPRACGSEPVWFKLCVSCDEATDTVFVQAKAPYVAGIANFITKLDESLCGTDKLHVVVLKSALAKDLAVVIKQALSQAASESGESNAPGSAGEGKQGYSLRFIPTAAPCSSPLAGVIDDFDIQVDIRTNSLLISAPPEAINLLLAVIRELDLPPSFNVSVNVYTLRHADATLVAGRLQKVQLGSALGTFNKLRQPLPPILGDVRITAEARTNSVIVTGCANELAAVGDLIVKQDGGDAATRRIEVIQLLHATADDVVKLLTPVLTDALIVCEPVSNKLIVSISPEDYDELLRLVKQIDVQPAQVRIEAMMAEVDVTGTELGLRSLGFDRTCPASDGCEFAFSMASENVAALVRELEKQGRIEIVSLPRIMTADNQAARVLIGQSFPYVVGSEPSANVQYRDIGTQLQVTPKISPDGTVTLRVIPEVSSVAESNVKIAKGVFAPVFNVQTLETTVVLQDGESAVLGGATQIRNVSATEKRKVELLVIVTAHVERGSRQVTPPMVSGEEEQGEEEQSEELIDPPASQGCRRGCGRDHSSIESGKSENQSPPMGQPGEIVTYWDKNLQVTECQMLDGQKALSVVGRMVLLGRDSKPVCCDGTLTVVLIDAKPSLGGAPLALETWTIGKDDLKKMASQDSLGMWGYALILPSKICWPNEVTIARLDVKFYPEQGGELFAASSNVKLTNSQITNQQDSTSSGEEEQAEEEQSEQLIDPPVHRGWRHFRDHQRGSGAGTTTVDVPPPGAKTFHVFKLTHAQAAQVKDMLQISLQNCANLAEPVDVRFTVDDDSNTLIATGSESDLAVVRALLVKWEECAYDRIDGGIAPRK